MTADIEEIISNYTMASDPDTMTPDVDAMAPILYYGRHSRHPAKPSDSAQIVTSKALFRVK